MKILRRRAHTNNIQFKSVNETIKIDLNYNNGPELMLANEQSESVADSVIVFLTYAGYYTLMGEKCIKLDTVDLDVLNVIAKQTGDDDVAHVKYDDKYKIVHVTTYLLPDGGPVYLFKLASI